MSPRSAGSRCIRRTTCERGGRFRHMLERARERWPLVTHGLTMGFGAVEPAEDAYMQPLRAFLHEIRRAVAQRAPVLLGRRRRDAARSVAAAVHARGGRRPRCARIREARDRLELPIAVENISYYAEAGHARDERARLPARGARARRRQAAARREQRVRQQPEPRLRSARATSTACRSSASCRSTSPVITCARTR